MDMLQYRRALPNDIDTLVALEQTFPGDRLSRRSFRRLIASRAADVWVCVSQDTLLADAVVLYRRGSAAARLYSIVVAEPARGRGIGPALVRMAEAAALRRGCRTLHLEVRVDNIAALALYRKLEYRLVRSLPGFYEDGQDGLRLQRGLVAADDIAA